MRRTEGVGKEKGRVYTRDVPVVEYPEESRSNSRRKRNDRSYSEEMGEGRNSWVDDNLDRQYSTQNSGSRRNRNNNDDLEVNSRGRRTEVADGWRGSVYEEKGRGLPFTNANSRQPQSDSTDNCKVRKQYTCNYC